MIERHITLAVHPGQGAALERFFTDEYRPPMDASPGFLDAWLLRALDSETDYQIVLRFEDPDAAVAWRTSAVHEALQPGLNALHGGMTIQPYEVVG